MTLEVAPGSSKAFSTIPQNTWGNTHIVCYEFLSIDIPITDCHTKFSVFLSIWVSFCDFRRAIRQTGDSIHNFQKSLLCFRCDEVLHKLYHWIVAWFFTITIDAIFHHSKIHKSRKICLLLCLIFYLWYRCPTKIFTNSGSRALSFSLVFVPAVSLVLSMDSRQEWLLIIWQINQVVVSVLSNASLNCPRLFGSRRYS